MLQESNVYTGEGAYVSRSSSIRCCDRHGLYVVFSGKGQSTKCASCLKEGAFDVESDASQDLREFSWLIGNVPEEVSYASFNNFSPVSVAQAHMLSFIQETKQRWLDGDFSQCGQMVFLGATNTGKTHLAAALIRSLGVSRGVFYADASDGLTQLAERSSMLVLDNLFEPGIYRSAMSVRDWNDMLYERCVNQMPTVLVSRLGAAQFKQKLNRRSLHWLRMANTKIIHFEG